MLYQIIHCYDTDGGFGDAVYMEDVIATVDATQEEVDEFIKEWDHPRIYDRPYAALTEHSICARPVEITAKLSELEPYDPREKYKTDLPLPVDYEKYGLGWSWFWENNKWVAKSSELLDGPGIEIIWHTDETIKPEWD